MACSDGVWDAFSSDKAARRVSRFVSPQGAAKRTCASHARERTEYRGMHADDITAVPWWTSREPAGRPAVRLRRLVERHS